MRKLSLLSAATAALLLFGLAGCGLQTNRIEDGGPINPVPPVPTPTDTPIALDMPEGVTANTDSFESITISWDEVPGAIVYKVFRVRGDGTEYALIGSTDRSSFSDTTVSAYTTYSYRVSAAAGASESANSLPTSAATPHVEIANVPFGDVILKNCVEENTVGFTFADEVLNIPCPSRAISSLNGMRHFVALEWVSFRQNDISDLTPLSSLSNLKQLRLDRNGITDVDALASLRNLQILDLNKNLIADVSPLSNLTNLLQLAVGWNQVDDISPLSNLTALLGLTLDSNSVEDVAPLATLTGLTGFSIQDNQVVSGVAALDTLTYASLINFLGNNEILCADLDSLEDALPQTEVVRPGTCVP